MLVEDGCCAWAHILDEWKVERQAGLWAETGGEVLGLGGEVVADAADGVALLIVQGEEFESVAEALAVADDGADFDGIRSEGQRNFESDDFAGFEAAGESGADAVLAHFGGASPTGAEFSGLKHFDLQADVNDETREAAREAGSCRYAPVPARCVLGS